MLLDRIEVQRRGVMKASGTLTFIQLNDTHAQMNLHWEYFWENGRAAYRKAGGFARLATLIQQIRAQYKDSLLVDCGDEIHGTGVAQWTQGAAVRCTLAFLARLPKSPFRLFGAA